MMPPDGRRCSACTVEEDDDSTRFEEEIGMAWIRGIVEGVYTAVGSPFPGDGLCRAHETHFRALMAKHQKLRDKEPPVTK